ncbi:hypothetical protein SAMN06297422_13110 [Lachnospiraceae bacterium]|nr:hypothetical protein SAMN06297422_13110 [Lachnospiraceae bacterium]
MDQQQIMDMYAQMMPAYIGSFLVSYVISAVAYMKIFEKAGVTTWYAWVPFLNTYWITKIATGNGWLFLIILIPCVGSLIYLILMAIKLSAAFGCGGGMIALLILIPIVGYLVLAFGSSQYVGPQ